MREKTKQSWRRGKTSLINYRFSSSTSFCDKDIFQPPMIRLVTDSAAVSSTTCTGNDKAQISESGSPAYSTLRSRYLVVHDLINDGRDDIGRPDSDKFETILNKVESLHQLVWTPREQVVDAVAFSSITNSLADSVKVHGIDGITPSDLVNSLLTDFGQEGRPGSSAEGGRVSVEWKNIGIAASHIFRSCPGCCTMLGPMNSELKKRKAIVRKHVQSSKRSKPEEVDGTFEEERTDTDKNMATMFNILRKKRSVKLENLILNRNSYAQTVENLFALSFLVKDGRAEIIVNENGCHLVSPKNAADASAVASGEAVYRHFVFRFDFKDWKFMVSSVEIGDEVMPNRNKRNLVYNQDIVSVESEEAGPDTRIRKLSRNRGLVSQEETMSEDSPHLLQTMKPG
ncbi:non-structural maintenance of chromosomes element 4 homolog A-like [Euphorbia lathyris]|uniref:non-structural maintenance of chromosomes element 4 homolog A-like n=1 Tax=Euphorbia lathyris TaxID=212925 RepID=UPI00331392E6